MKLRFLPFYSLFLICLSTLLFSACQRDIIHIDDPQDDGPTIDFTKKVTTASVSGFITDKNGAALSGVTITAGNKTTVTDEAGFFMIRQPELVKGAGVIKAVKAGFFTGIRTINAIAGKPAFVRIQMLERTLIGSLPSAGGGIATAADGFSVTLPENSVVVDGTGATYNGEVKVYAHWINVGDRRYGEQMPGDLRALDGDATKLLTSYGMAAVELEGNAGQKLQIASGKQAKLSFPMPSGINNAPATMPMWWFDEVKGLWIKEGSCVKVGNNYITEVSHFTYWNCDMPYDNPITLSFTLLNADSTPMNNSYVIISGSNQYQSIHAMTDSTGYASGFAPVNTQLTLTVYSYSYGSNCSSVYSQNITTTLTDLDLGNIYIPQPSANTYHISGTAFGCDNVPISSGHVFIGGGVNQSFAISNGTFDFTYYSCEPVTNLQLFAIDYSHPGAYNSPTTITLTTGANQTVDLVNCGTVNESTQFFNLTLSNQSSYMYNGPQDTLRMWNANTGAHITARTPGVDNWVIIGFVGTNITATGTYETTSININSNEFISSSAVPVHFTEYGGIGNYAAGNFAGPIMLNDSLQTQLYMEGSFRVRITE